MTKDQLGDVDAFSRMNFDRNTFAVVVDGDAAFFAIDRNLEQVHVLVVLLSHIISHDFSRRMSGIPCYQPH